HAPVPPVSVAAAGRANAEPARAVTPAISAGSETTRSSGGGCSFELRPPGLSEQPPSQPSALSSARAIACEHRGSGIVIALRLPLHLDRYAAARRGAVAQLADAAVPPAIRRSTSAKAAIMCCARAERGEREPASDRHGNPIRVGRAAPAVRGSTGRDPAGMVPTDAQQAEREPTRHGHGNVAFNAGAITE